MHVITLLTVPMKKISEYKKLAMIPNILKGIMYPGMVPFIPVALAKSFGHFVLPLLKKLYRKFNIDTLLNQFSLNSLKMYAFNDLCLRKNSIKQSIQISDVFSLGDKI